MLLFLNADPLSIQAIWLPNQTPAWLSDAANMRLDMAEAGLVL